MESLVLVALLIGALVGLILGLTGAGGSIVAVPLLTLALSLSLHESTGLALLAVFASAAFGVATRIYARQIVWLPGLVLALTGAAAAPFGRVVAGAVPEPALVTAFALLSVTISVRMWRDATTKPDATRVVRAGSDTGMTAAVPLCRMNDWQPMQLRFRCMAGLAGAGAGIGLLSGLFGVGGGFLIVPVMTYLTDMGIRQAVSTSLLVISLVSLSGFASHIALGDASNITLALPLAAGGVLGMLGGNRLSRRLSGPSLQRIFAVTVVVLTVVMVLRKLMP